MEKEGDTGTEIEATNDYATWERGTTENEAKIKTYENTTNSFTPVNFKL